MTELAGKIVFRLAGFWNRKGAFPIEIREVAAMLEAHEFTIRDEFAIAALPTLIAMFMKTPTEDLAHCAVMMGLDLNKVSILEVTATQAYRYADAMLAARTAEKKGVA